MNKYKLRPWQFFLLSLIVSFFAVNLALIVYINLIVKPKSYYQSGAGAITAGFFLMMSSLIIASIATLFYQYLRNKSIKGKKDRIRKSNRSNVFGYLIPNLYFNPSINI